MTDRELMQQALDALVWANEYLVPMGKNLFPKSNKAQPGSTVWHVEKAIAALRRALEQQDQFAEPRNMVEQPPQQEPMACKHSRYSVDTQEQTGTCYDCGAEGRMKFVVDNTTTPHPHREPLTDDEIAVIAAACGGLASDFVVSVARAIEAAHGIGEKPDAA